MRYTTCTHTHTNSHSDYNVKIYGDWHLPVSTYIGGEYASAKNIFLDFPPLSLVVSFDFSCVALSIC